MSPRPKRWVHQRVVTGAGIALIAIGVATLPVPRACAQQQPSNPSTQPSSDLTSRNLSRVAASAAEIKTVLVEEAGLMVEVRRWVAKDATAHGQVVSDKDLSTDAIFVRLETDIQFRSAITTLVQQYGYLVPKLNPESDQAKEHLLLVQERTKWIAQSQEEERGQARQRLAAGQAASQNSGDRTQSSTICNLQGEQSCNALQNGGSQSPQREAPAEQSPAMVAPGNPNSGPLRGNVVDGRTQLTDMQTGSSGFLPLSGSSGVGLMDASYGYGSNFPGMNGSASGFGADNGQASLSNRYAAAFNGGGAGANGGMGLSGMELNASNELSDLNGMNGPPGDMMMRNSSVVQLQPPGQPRMNNAVLQAPNMVRKQSPYSDIPALYDMYMQAAPQPSTPQRFGSAVFENGTRNLQWMPMDMPAGPDYVVGPGDGLTVNLWGGVSQRLYRTVDREGRISLPEVGPVLVSGKSLTDLQEGLQQILRSQFRDVSADVSLSRLRTIRIYEVGEVSSAGAYDISSLSTPLNALFAGGGPTAQGSMRILKHYRGDQLVQIVDVYDLLLHGVKTNLQRLENGDTVLVPPIGSQVTVEGMVRRPAVYELKDEKTLADVLELAGGLLPAAALRHIEVQRIVTHEKQTMLSLDIPEASADADVTKKLESFEIRDGDRIRIFPIAEYNQNAVYLEGHVLRPGKYSYRENMRVTDVLSNYKDLLPEPATQYAEIIRLNEPDFRPSVEGFDLAKALEDPSQAPVLHPLDTIRVFSRFDFENAPEVSVLGDVRGPGTYQTSGTIRLSDAIHLAGGLSPDAERGDAQVFRYLPDGKSEILSVSLSEALAGNPVANIVLQSRDRLLIHRNPQDVEPATVYLEGEVASPGRYPLTMNMRVADLVRVGGGFKDSADTQSADLTQYQWSEQMNLTADHKTVELSAALSGESSANAPLHNGDVLTIRQRPGWDDLGASITVKGQVQHPGTYGIRPGEKLSSILARAGGFQPDAYPYGIILQRDEVRELQKTSQDAMIIRVKNVEKDLELLPEGNPRQKEAKEMAVQQWQTMLQELNANPPLGRVSVHVSSNVNQWKNTSADIEVRAGDTLIIPKKPSYVLVTGQVLNSTAISYRPGKSAKWYLAQAGGPTQLADKKSIMVVRADGSVMGSKNGIWSGESFSAALQPGDTVVVPERVFTGGMQWQSIFSMAQVASAVASTVFIALHY